LHEELVTFPRSKALTVKNTSAQSVQPMEVQQANSDLLKNSVLYKEFLAEREEILRHKWLESEKLGHDIGFEKALLDWIIKYRSSWREKRLKHHHA
jgi:hypothetical protein